MPIEREITDKDMAIRFIQGMDNRVTIRTIIRRLQVIESSIEMAGKMIDDGVLDEKTAVDWLVAHLKSYESASASREYPSPSQDGPGQIN